jgi:hypothetical protein
MHEENLSQGKESRGTERLRWLALSLQNPLQDLGVSGRLIEVILTLHYIFFKEKTPPVCETSQEPKSSSQ